VQMKEKSLERKELLENNSLLQCLNILKTGNLHDSLKTAGRSSLVGYCGKIFLKTDDKKYQSIKVIKCQSSIVSLKTIHLFLCYVLVFILFQ
jgi:hypothetical protein